MPSAYSQVVEHQQVIWLGVLPQFARSALTNLPRLQPSCPTLPFIVEEWIKSRKRRRVSDAYLKTISVCSRRLARSFPGPLSDLSCDSFLSYLDELPGQAARTRNNHLLIARQLARFAQRMGWLSFEWRELDKLEKEVEPPSEANIYTPEKIKRILNGCPDSIRALIVLVAFCGVRTAEALRLSWSFVDLESGRVTIPARRAKTRSRRLCPIPANAKAWLAIERATRGDDMDKIYEGTPRQVQTAMQKCFRDIGMDLLRNGLRHSFISYRVAVTKDAAMTALEAGTSESMVFANYRELSSPEMAREWFNVWPGEGLRIVA